MRPRQFGINVFQFSIWFPSAHISYICWAYSLYLFSIKQIDFGFLLRHMLELEENIYATYKYNMHSQIINALGLMVNLVDTDLIVTKILPTLEQRLSAVCFWMHLNCKIFPNDYLSIVGFDMYFKRTIPVRLSAVKSILIALRRIPICRVRKEYLMHLLGK